MKAIETKVAQEFMRLFEGEDFLPFFLENLQIVIDQTKHYVDYHNLRSCFVFTDTRQGFDCWAELSDKQWRAGGQED